MAAYMTRNMTRSLALRLSSRRWASTSNVSRLRGTPHLKRKLGQHLLVSDGVLDDIVAAAELPTLLSTRDAAVADQPLRVLEIGPGTGNLTSALLRAHPSVQVHAVEYDGRMVEQLQQRFQSELSASDGAASRLELEHTDFEAFHFGGPEVDREADNAPMFDACVANIPYQLSSLVVSRLSSYMQRYPDRFRCAVLLVQEEFALRLLAQPGEKNYSRLSANTALVCDVASVVEVPRTHFLPPPKVDSRVIKLTPRVSPLPTLPRDDALFFRRFDALLRLCFQRKNKTLRALLLAKTARAQYELAADVLAAEDPKQAVTERVEAALATCGLSSSRAVKIPVTDFMALLRALQHQGLDLRPSSTRHFQE